MTINHKFKPGDRITTIRRPELIRRITWVSDAGRVVELDGKWFAPSWSCRIYPQDTIPEGWRLVRQKHRARPLSWVVCPVCRGEGYFFDEDEEGDMDEFCCKRCDKKGVILEP